MKNIRVFTCKYFQFLEVNFSIYLNRHVFVMTCENVYHSLQLTMLLTSFRKSFFAWRFTQRG